jgi:hypothetical protein
MNALAVGFHVVGKQGSIAPDHTPIKVIQPEGAAIYAASGIVRQV